MKKIVFICTICAMLCLSACMGNTPKQTLPDNIIKPKSSAIYVPEISVLPRKDIADMLKPVANTDSKTASITDISLNIPTSFKITRPDNKITTTYDKYFITGTSDSKRPVYFGDEEIERIGSKGTFGVLVDLKLGDNKFTFSQGEKTQTVTITRKSYVAPESVPISDIRQSSMIPAVFSGVNAGETLDVGCIAPSGATVTAAFGGKTVNLSQVAQTAKEGIPAFFKGKIEVGSNYDPDVTQKAGKVVYTMSYGEKNKKYESTGNVYVAGPGGKVAVRVTSYMGFVYPDLKDLSVFREKLKEGAADYIKSQDNTYVRLESGGYVAKEQVAVIVGETSIQNKLSKVRLASASKDEAYTFSGTTSPAYLTRLSNGKFSFTLFNTTGFPSVNMSSSKLFSGVEVENGSNYVTYTFTQSNAAKLWGYNVSYNGKDTVLSFNYRPSLGSDSKPLSGLTIILDPGHGGTDNGALGIAALTGPTEQDVNLAHAIAARDLLESMGANVILTRTQGENYSLDDRLADSEKLNADMFISIHHNSIGENKDANTIKGVEVYYHTAMSKKLAQNLMTSVSGIGRQNRFVSQSYYRVTLSPYAPAVLLELGYMSNPLEYERAANSSQMDKVAKAIAGGITAALS